MVGLILTAVNQLQVILDGHPTLATWIRCAANFLIPFVVSNLGVLTGARSDASGTD